MTSNVRFWKDSGIAVDLTSAGMRVEMGSLTTLFGGGVSFDVPEGLGTGPAGGRESGRLPACLTISEAFRMRSTPITLTS